MTGPIPESPPRRALLAVAAFTAGWSLMMLEILGGRLMAPHFGYSVYQWGAVIGVVLAFMAGGYWAGGRLGDGPWAGIALRAGLVAGGAWAAATPWLGRPLLATAAAVLSPGSGAVLGAVAILGVPSFALAMVSPVAAGLGSRGASGLEGAAAATGRVTAVGTLGSIGGTFFAAFIAIPELGISAGYAIAAALPMAAAAIAPGARDPRARRDVGAGGLLALLATVGAQLATPDPGQVFSQETAYNTIVVTDDGSSLRLHLNALWATQSRLRKDGGPTGLYYDLFNAGPALTRGRKVLVLGLAGGVAAMQIARTWEGSDVLGVELDPAVVDVARRWFGLSGVQVAVGDARRFVESDGESFDLVIVDLYATAVIPFFTATQEFFAAVARRLAPGGVVMMNVAAPAEPDALVGPLAATLATVFPSVFVADARRGNWIVLATAETRSAADLTARLKAVPPGAATAAGGLAATLAPAATAGFPVFTDERSDIDLRSLTALYGR
jgi:predicted membrane-bound spermidine synthase